MILISPLQILIYYFGVLSLQAFLPIIFAFKGHKKEEFYKNLWLRLTQALMEITWAKLFK
jgi:hypothetical protein